MQHWIKFGSVLLAVTLISSCARSPKRILQNNGPTMEQMITASRSVGYVGTQQPSRRVTDREALANYTRTATNEIEQLFPFLDNPTIAIFVYPHLSTASGAPIPGYTTAIKLYPADVYALPGETAVAR